MLLAVPKGPSTGVRTAAPPHLTTRKDEELTWTLRHTAAKYGASMDLSFSGVATFAHLPHERCLDAPDKAFDIAVLGMPYDVSRCAPAFV